MALLNNEATLNAIKAEALAALREVEDRHGIDFKFGNLTYDGDGDFFRAKLEASRRGADSPATNPNQDALDLFHKKQAEILRAHAEGASGGTGA